MPNMDGYELTKVLREQGNTIPIIALTANALSGESKNCQNLGMDGYLTKPVSMAILKQTIEQYLQGEQDHSLASIEYELSHDAELVEKLLDDANIDENSLDEANLDITDLESLSNEELLAHINTGMLPDESVYSEQSLHDENNDISASPSTSLPSKRDRRTTERT